MVDSNVARIRPADEKSFRLAPHNVEAEQALLGAILVNNEAFYRVSDFLGAEHFYEPIHREIYEESGIELTDVRYFGSQPWPFPHSLMIGFTAQYASGEITIDPKEIADAQWFTLDTLPRVPQKLSIARRLIDSYVAKHGPPLDQP